MKLSAIVLEIVILLNMSLVTADKVYNNCKNVTDNTTAEGKEAILPIYPIKDSCACSYENIFHEGCASNCVSCGLCEGCFDDCIACYPGYELDIKYKDGTGSCVEKGTAKIPLGAMSDLYPGFESTMCPDIALGGYVGEIKKVTVNNAATAPNKPESTVRKLGLYTSAAIIISSIFSFSF